MVRNTAFGNVKNFVGNLLGGLRGGANLASWVVAGTAAYFLWVKPERDARKEQEARAALMAETDRYRYIERRRPIADPQETGLILGKKKENKEAS